MRTRRPISFALLVVLASLPLVVAPATAFAAQRALEGDGGVVLAQDQETDDGEGQSGADAETGAGEDEEAPAAEEETGPVWTYQMARLGLGLLVLLLAAVGFTYWKLVAQRQRSGV